MVYQKSASLENSCDYLIINFDILGQSAAKVCGSVDNFGGFEYGMSSIDHRWEGEI